MEAVRLRRRLEGALPPIGAAAKESKRLSPSTVAVLQQAVNLRPGASVTVLTAETADAMLGSTQPSTANQYASSIKAFFHWCETTGERFDPPSGDAFATYVLTRPEAIPQRGRRAAPRTLFAAMNFFAALARFQSPTSDLGALSARDAIRRRLGQRNARATPIFAADLAPGAHPIANPPEEAEPLSVLASRVHLLVLQAGKLRYDDTYRSNVGDLVFVPNDRIDLPLFGTKTDLKREGQRSLIPFSGSPDSAYASLVELLRQGSIRLATLPQKIRDHLIDDFVASVCAEPLPATITSFPRGCLEPLLGLRSSVSGQPLPVHKLPLFGAWLTKDKLGLSSHLTARTSYKPLLRLVKKAAAKANLDPGTVGLHSLRRGGAFEMEAGLAPEGLIGAALRHTTQASTKRYCSPAMTAARVAAASRETAAPAPPAAAPSGRCG